MQESNRIKKTRLILNAVILAILAVVIFFAVRPPQVELSKNYICISGLYGVELRMQDIDQLELRESLPQIKARINGIDLFSFVRRGIYDLEGLGRTRLISFSNGGPYVLFRAGNEWVVINFKNPEDTEALYQSIENALNE